MVRELTPEGPPVSSQTEPGQAGLRVEPYSQRDREAWDGFVARSKNATFLFRRAYMEYHADRFPDSSLVIRDDKGSILALLPATRSGDELISHDGLTYGGFLTDDRMTVEMMLNVFAATLSYLSADNVQSLIYKTIPRIYHRSPADEDLYALFRVDGDLYRRDVLSVIEYAGDRAWESRWRNRMSRARRAEQAGVVVQRTTDFAPFWELLADNLARRYGVRPVHNLAEIQQLAAAFPGSIQLTGAYRDGALLAGALTFLCGQTLHVQYNATSPDGRAIRALDLLLAHLVESARARFRYFDFGISTEQDGRVLNEGLIDYKQRFGARAVSHDFYRIVVPR